LREQQCAAKNAAVFETPDTVGDGGLRNVELARKIGKRAAGIGVQAR
jgi:hypothetical protein